jgi:hypothetical protein
MKLANVSRLRIGQGAKPEAKPGTGYLRDGLQLFLIESRNCILCLLSLEKPWSVPQDSFAGMTPSSLEPSPVAILQHVNARVPRVSHLAHIHRVPGVTLARHGLSGALHAENEIRNDFMPSQRVAIAEAMEDGLREKDRRGRPKADPGQET